MASANGVTLWLKSEPFTIGSLPSPPHPRLTVNNIKKIVSYAKTKGKAGFPNLSYSVWRHIACNKLQLLDDVAWMYFVTFDLINDTTPEQHLEFDRKAADQQENLRNQLTVPTLRFVLFLYVQHIHKISLRASLVSGTDEWPTRARSPDLEGRSSSAGGKALDENSHLTFVLNNLDVFLDLLTEPADNHHSAVVYDTKDLQLSMDAVESLEFLIAGSIDSNKTIRPLHEIAVLSTVQQFTGFSKTSRSFSFRSMQTWLRSQLIQNPFGVSCCIAQGRHLSWPMHGESKEMWAQRKCGRIATNAAVVPRDQTRGNKLIVMSQVSRQTIARSSSTLDGSAVKIHRCHGAFIYLLSPLRSVSIEKCQRSTIILGPVETSIDVVRCEDTTVIGIGRRVTTIGNKSCRLHISTPNRPLVFSGNESLIFAPYHTHYPLLESHMLRAGLRPQPNLWDQPLYMGTEHQDDDMWEILKPADFSMFTIPFEMEGDTREAPGLPARYRKAIIDRMRSVEAWQSYVKSANLTKEQKRNFKKIVETRFQEWLQMSGHLRQLDGLAIADST